MTTENSTGRHDQPIGIADDSDPTLRLVANRAKPEGERSDTERESGPGSAYHIDRLASVATRSPYHVMFVDVRARRSRAALCQNCVTCPGNPRQTPSVTGTRRRVSMLREVVDRKCVGGLWCA